MNAIITDRRTANLTPNSSNPSTWDAVALYNSDYYPYGMQLPNRHSASGDYRYGFNGMEADDEVKGNGNSYDFGARMYDSRVGRWLSRDPLEAKYVEISPYTFVMNMPIVAIDPDGKDVIIVIYSGKDSRYKQAAWTRVREVKNSSSFNKETDKVIMMHVSDLGKLNEQIKGQLTKNVKEKYGHTTEFSYFGHGANHGPVGEQYASGNHNLSDETRDNLDGNQMTLKGWSEIDFNFDNSRSMANFYGCQMAGFAEKFAVFQDAAFTSGYSGKAGPTTNPNSFESSWFAHDKMYLWDGEGLMIYANKSYAGSHQDFYNPNANANGIVGNDPTSTYDWSEHADGMRPDNISSGEFSTNTSVDKKGKIEGHKKED